MTDVEKVERELLSALDEIGPAARADLEHELRDRLEKIGMAGGKAAAIIDGALREWSTAEPPLVSSAWDPAEVDHLGRLREGAARLWELTTAGDARLARLDRLYAA